MHEPDPFARLPEAYGRALRLRREGAGEATIATELGIHREAVGSLLRIAEAKLATLTTASDASVQRLEDR
jgi:orotate phosphoribosyltransferase-like protein